MTLKERVENNLVIFFLTAIVIGFGSGFSAYEIIDEKGSSDNIIISKSEKHDFDQKVKMYDDLTKKYTACQASLCELKEKRLLAHIISEELADSLYQENEEYRVTQIERAIKELPFIKTDDIDIRQNPLQRIEEKIDDVHKENEEVKIVIMHRHAFDRNNTITYETIKKYLHAFSNILIIVYSDSFSDSNEYYYSELDRQDIDTTKIELVYYDYHNKVQQKNARYDILLSILKFASQIEG